MRFRFPGVDSFSFWLGIILATLVWWIYSLLHPVIQNLRSSLLSKQSEKREKTYSSTNIEDHYRQGVLHRAQGLHLAASLFSLDEIIVTPALLAPPPRVEPGVTLYNDGSISTTIPYLPAWPELAAIYHAPTLTLAQALSGNSDIVLTGQTGIGKTVALAHLASRLARRDPEPGLPLDTVPFLVHIADLDLPGKKEEPLKPLIDAIAEKTPIFDIPRLPDFVRNSFTDGHALLLLDGTDELTPDGMKIAVDFIKSVKKVFPKTRMVTTASSDYLDGLVSLNFIPLALATWNSNQRLKFLEKWGDLWTNYVAVEAWAQTSEQSDPLLLNNWIITESSSLTPFELTLKTWGAYAGDTLGFRPMDALETHIRRLSPTDVPREALETLALQMIMSTEPIFDPRKAREWIKTFEPPDIVRIPVKTEESDSSKSEKLQAPTLNLIGKMVESSLLTQHRNNRLRFTHPVMGGYLAGKALANLNSDALLNQPPWIGKFLALNFKAALGDATPIVDRLLSELDRPLSRNLLTPARWLRDSPRSSSWRGKVIVKLVELLHQTGQPLGLRGQALCALIQSGETSVVALFRQLLEDHDFDVQQLAALGVGALQDSKSIELLASLLNSQNPNVRSAACLSLASIGTPAALDNIASSLLHGDENLRRSAAEALALHPGEGHAMLKEGAEMKDDLLVRRSSAYGLGHISEPWAEELLLHLETTDDQWAVRNAATEVLEIRQRSNPHIPNRLPPPTESPWIIAFAGKQGMGVSPDKPPTDLLLLALKSGTEEERLAALSYLRMAPVEGVFGALFQAMYGGELTLREAVFQTFSEMAARGVYVPDPVQFGVGY
jgi:HEAT repeat protein